MKFGRSMELVGDAAVKVQVASTEEKWPKITPWGENHSLVMYPPTERYPDGVKNIVSNKSLLSDEDRVVINRRDQLIDEASRALTGFSLEKLSRFEALLKELEGAQ